MTDRTPAIQPRRSAGSIQSIRRAFLVLEAVVDHDGPVGVSDLSRICDLPIGTIHRMAQSLLELGYVWQDQHSKYLPGARLLMLAKSNQETIAAVAQPYLDDLAERFGESVALGTLQGDYIVYLAKKPGSRAIRIFNSIGDPVYPHSAAIGKMLLSEVSDARIRTVLAHTQMPRFTDSTITDPDAFLAEIATVRRQGYAMNEGEQEEGMRCVSVAIPFAGQLLGFSLSAPTLRLPDDVLETVLEGLTASADALALELHGTANVSLAHHEKK